MEETEEKLADRERDKPRQSNGEWLYRTLKPAGCVFVLLLAAMALVVCFTAGADPIKGYVPPESGEYYAANPGELAAELNENVLPRLNTDAVCAVSGGKVRVEIPGEDFAVTRSALLRYFDGELLECVEKAPRSAAIPS